MLPARDKLLLPSPRLVSPNDSFARAFSDAGQDLPVNPSIVLAASSDASSSAATSASPLTADFGRGVLCLATP